MYLQYITSALLFMVLATALPYDWTGNLPADIAEAEPATEYKKRVTGSEPNNPAGNCGLWVDLRAAGTDLNGTVCSPSGCVCGNGKKCIQLSDLDGPIAKWLLSGSHPIDPGSSGTCN